MTAIPSAMVNQHGVLAEQATSQREGLSLPLGRGLLAAGLLAAPLAFGAVPPWAWAALAALVVLLLTLWAVEQVKQRQVAILWSPLYAPVLLFFAFAASQFFMKLTRDRIATREALIKLATDLLLFLVVRQLLATAPKSAWRTFAATVTIFAFAVSLFAIFQYFSGGGLIYWRVRTASGCTFGPYLNHNHYAGLMEMLIPIAVGGLLGRRPSPVRRLLGFALLVAMASLLLSGSRGGFISIVAEILILSVVLIRCAPASRRQSRALALTLGIAAGAILFVWMDPGHISKRLATVADLPQRPEVPLAERLTVSQDTLRMFTHYPWVGVGLGSFEVAYPRYQSFATDLTWDHAHNDYAEALAETGIVGAVLILIALGLFFRLAFRDLRGRLKHEVGWIQFGATLGCCGLLVHSFGDFNFHIPANAAWFAVCAAIATQPTLPRSHAS
jgi:O-antigen ligase